jgi:hypothetical protein
MVFGASYEADRLNDDPNNDIRAILDVIARLSIEAKTQLAQCTVRDFNVGFHCWDSWAYNYSLTQEVISAVADSGCSVSITLYPMRYPDGTPKIDNDEG